MNSCTVNKMFIDEKKLRFFIDQLYKSDWKIAKNSAKRLNRGWIKKKRNLISNIYKENNFKS